MALYLTWDVKNGFAYVLTFFLNYFWPSRWCFFVLGSTPPTFLNSEVLTGLTCNLSRANKSERPSSNWSLDFDRLPLTISWSLSILIFHFFFDGFFNGVISNYLFGAKKQHNTHTYDIMTMSIQCFIALGIKTFFSFYFSWRILSTFEPVRMFCHIYHTCEILDSSKWTTLLCNFKWWSHWLNPNLSFFDIAFLMQSYAECMKEILEAL